MFDHLPPDLKAEVSAANAASNAAIAPLWSDDRLAEALVERHGRDLRYVAAWAQWLTWDGSRWRPDDTLAIFDLARKLCRDTLAANPGVPKEGAKALSDAATFASVERVARSDRRVAATTAVWDANPLLLATPGGTVDLRTGIMRDAKREDFATKATAIAPAETADCPTWLAFLVRITNSDAALCEYLKRLAGYSLTGSISEHMLAFFYGTGANGKGTFINTVTGMMGDYAVVASADVFRETRTDRHPTELAALRGARLVAAQETEQGSRWAETRIKTLTGGDPITARFMRADFFTFAPTFTLIIAGNHKPGLRTVDEAIRRRLHMVPFAVTIPAAERDRDLAEKLQSEWPAILRWAIDGCMEWRRDGLRPPDAVLAATAEYFEGADAFSQWLDECTERAKVEWQRENTSDLFGSWKAWAERAGEPVGSQRTFAEGMNRAGFVKKADPSTRRMGFAPIRLRRHDYSEDPRYGA